MRGVCAGPARPQLLPSRMSHAVKPSATRMENISWVKPEACEGYSRSIAKPPRLTQSHMDISLHKHRNSWMFASHLRAALTVAKPIKHIMGPACSPPMAPADNHRARRAQIDGASSKASAVHPEVAPSTITQIYIIIFNRTSHRIRKSPRPPQSRIACKCAL